MMMMTVTFEIAYEIDAQILGGFVDVGSGGLARVSTCPIESRSLLRSVSPARNVNVKKEEKYVGAGGFLPNNVYSETFLDVTVGGHTVKKFHESWLKVSTSLHIIIPLKH